MPTDPSGGNFGPDQASTEEPYISSSRLSQLVWAAGARVRTSQIPNIALLSAGLDFSAVSAVGLLWQAILHCVLVGIGHITWMWFSPLRQHICTKRNGAGAGMGLDFSAANALVLTVAGSPALCIGGYWITWV